MKEDLCAQRGARTSLGINSDEPAIPVHTFKEMIILI